MLRRVDAEVIRRSDAWRALGLLGRQPAPLVRSAQRGSAPFITTFADDPDNYDTDFAFSVVMPTTLRDTLPQALRSVFAQDLPGRVQTLIGVDVARGSPRIVADACRARPSNHVVTVFYPGYSTSVRHGGLHPAWDGGVLRTTLSYLASSRYLAYLDDDNWWRPDHLSTMARALAGHEWAWSRRWFVHPVSRQPICEDEWEAIGPGDRGVFAADGGWVDPNCLAFDKIACEAVLRWWGIPQRNSRFGTDADRGVFQILSERFRGRGTGEATVYYALNEKDPEQEKRVEAIGGERYRAAGIPKLHELVTAGQ